MASTPRPETGTVFEVTGAATASVAVNAPVAAVAPMKWRRSMLMALPRFGEQRFKKRAAAAVPPRDTPSRLTAMGGDERQQNRLSGAHERRLRDSAFACRPPGAARDR